MNDSMSRVWGRFEIIKERGSGGMAVVYRAYDKVLQRTVALKVLSPRLAANQEITQRFRREAITAANLKHPNIVIIYDVGSYTLKSTGEEFQFIVMEYLEGPTLQREIQDKGALPAARVVPLLQQLAGALDYAHQQGLIHRDVKPANVIIGAKDHVTLTDFGLVKAVERGDITGEGTAIGTLKYMSPEQIVGKDVDYRSDIYSLGVVVYEALSGEVPFSGTTPYQIMHELIHEPPPPLSRVNPDVDPKVEQVVLKALAKQADRRFRTSGEFARALAQSAGIGAAVDWDSDTAALNREVVLLLNASDGREFPVCRGTTTIGRDTGSDIVLPVRQVSRHHARIRCDEKGCRVVDPGSTNGTLVNGVRIPPETPWSLRPDDVLTVGPMKLLVTRPSDSPKRKEFRTLNMDPSQDRKAGKR